MKTINLNAIKTIVILLALSTLTLLSCNNIKKKTNIKVKEGIADAVEKEQDNTDIEAKDENINENVVKTRSYTMKDRTTPIVYDLDINGVVGFKDWTDFTVVNYELQNLRNTNVDTTKVRLEDLNYRMANLRTTIPDWLQTEEVMEDVAAIQKEYLKLISDKDASDDEMKENLEEVFEKFDDLRKELDETVTQYMKIHEHAIEEFNEEIKNMDEIIEDYQ
ncbi:hypothetical protein [Polaribacter sp.]|uniref:hypothetical protein n=1 Tax=Polaribacter sp. TaxID=1920175 RepID=UPI003F6C88C3